MAQERKAQLSEASLQGESSSHGGSCHSLGKVASGVWKVESEVSPREALSGYHIKPDLIRWHRMGASASLSLGIPVPK